MPLAKFRIMAAAFDGKELKSQGFGLARIGETTEFPRFFDATLAFLWFAQGIHR
jgi:hypothetical protein